MFDGLNAVLGYNDAFDYVANLLGLDLDELCLENFNGTAQSSVLKDALGSLVALTGSTQSLSDTYSYEPYGTSTHVGTSINGSMFAGQAYDFNNLYLMRNRYHLPSIARFISGDPAGGGVNPYPYAGDSPTNFSNPTGNWLLDPGNCDSCFSGPDGVAIPHGVGARVPRDFPQLVNQGGS